MEYRSLGQTGMEVSVLGFGASSLGGVFHEIDEQAGIRATRLALERGINYIDVSPYYGLTKAETVLGRALEGVPRDAYYLSTKVGRYGDDPEEAFDFSAQRVTASVDESLSRLGVDYVDLVFCHDIEFGDPDQVVNETIPALRALRDQGKVRFIGVSGYPLKIFRYVIERTELDCILSYCRYSLNDTGLEELLPFLHDNGVGVVNASPLSMGLLTRRGAPDWHPASKDIRAACRRAADHCADRDENLSKLAIQFSTANPQVPTTLVSTANPEHIEQNLRWLEEPVDAELLAEVREILAPVKNRAWLSGRPENNCSPGRGIRGTADHEDG